MSRSLEYIKNRLSSDGTTFSDRDMNKAIECMLDQFVKLSNGEIMKVPCRTNDGKRFTVNLIYNPDADFEYFTSSVSIHDGTMLFVYGTIEDCINKILNLETYDSRKKSPEEIELNGCEITYTIGNIILINECDDKFAPEDKKWMRERTTVMIPLIYDCKEKNT